MFALAEFVVVGDEVLAEVAAELHGFGFGFVEMLHCDLECMKKEW